VRTADNQRTSIRPSSMPGMGALGSCATPVTSMMEYRQVEQTALFYEFSLERHIPDDYLLRSIDRFVDLDQVTGTTLRRSTEPRFWSLNHRGLAERYASPGPARVRGQRIDQGRPQGAA
jgi:hypothetical protein